MRMWKVDVYKTMIIDDTCILCIILDNLDSKIQLEIEFTLSPEPYELCEMLKNCSFYTKKEQYYVNILRKKAIPYVHINELRKTNVCK